MLALYKLNNGLCSSYSLYMTLQSQTTLGQALGILLKCLSVLGKKLCCNELENQGYSELVNLMLLSVFWPLS